jgi:predicted RNA binding protein YcfA (HicA-like mRNA interferase family)
MKFRDFIRILRNHSFELDRQGGGSHRIYKGRIRGQTRLVVVACHRESDEVAPGTLSSMIRQSGLPQRAFASKRLKRRQGQ